MKKVIAAALSFALAVSGADAAELVFTIGTRSAERNGESISSYSYLSDKGNTMVEIRTVSETLGCAVEWLEDTREVRITDEGLDMLLKIGSDTAVINGSDTAMTEAAVIVNDRTYVPIRFVSESFGAQVEYEHESKRVTVLSADYEDRIILLKAAEPELMTSYYNAVSGFVSTTDAVIDAQSFGAVWDSLVNSKIMELMPNRAVDEAICEKYRAAAGMDFASSFALTEENGYIRTASSSADVSFVYDPLKRTLTLNGTLPTPAPVIIRGGGGSSRARATAVPTAQPEETAAPTAEPSSEPTAVPTPEPTAEATAAPTAAPTPDTGTEWASSTATPEPTKRPHHSSGGGSGGGEEDPDETEEPEETHIPEETDAPIEDPAIPTDGPDETTVPTAEPTEMPEETAVPTAEPTEEPEETAAPTAEPTEMPAETAVSVKGTVGNDLCVVPPTPAGGGISPIWYRPVNIFKRRSICSAVCRLRGYMNVTCLCHLTAGGCSPAVRNSPRPKGS